MSHILRGTPTLSSRVVRFAVWSTRVSFQSLVMKSLDYDLLSQPSFFQKIELLLYLCLRSLDQVDSMKSCIQICYDIVDVSLTSDLKISELEMAAGITVLALQMAKLRRGERPVIEVLNEVKAATGFDEGKVHEYVKHIMRLI